MPQPSVIVTPEEFVNNPAKCVDLLKESGFQVAFPEDSTFTRGLCSEDETVRVLEPFDAVIAGGEVLTPSVLSRLPNLRVIARSGVGYDRVDVPAATANGVVLTITPTANHECVAEQALALLFGIAKRVLVKDRNLRNGTWDRVAVAPLREQTIGIVGLGRIGRSLAVRCIALGMNVLATDAYPDQDFLSKHAVQLVELDELLAASDYVSVHCPLLEETRGLFNAEAFAKMKRGAVLVNTARGPLVNEKDLVSALESGQLSGAGLDVFEVEPPAADNPLFARDDVLISPHIGGCDWLSNERMGLEAADCIIKLHAGEWPARAVINRELQDGWTWAR